MGIVGEDSVNLYLDGNKLVATVEHPMFSQIKEMCDKTLENKCIMSDEEAEKLTSLFDVGHAIQYEYNDFKIEDDVVFYKGKPLHNELTGRIVRLLGEGKSYVPVIRLLENLFKNPSYRVRHDLPQWIDSNKFPITEDGCILALKKVREDFLDSHSGTMDNSVGNVVEMPRDECDDNFLNTCSSGLHFANVSYVSWFSGTRVIVLKINPADIVAFPRDYGLAKGRACRYEVLREVDDLDDPFNGNDLVEWNTKVDASPLTEQPSYEDYEDYDEDDYDYDPDEWEDDEDNSSYDPVKNNPVAIFDPTNGRFTTYDGVHEDFAEKYLGRWCFLDPDIGVYYDETKKEWIDDNGFEYTVFFDQELDEFDYCRSSLFDPEEYPYYPEGPTIATEYVEEPNDTDESELVFERPNGDTFTKQEILRIVNECETKAEIEKKYGIPRSTLNGWLKKIEESEG